MSDQAPLGTPGLLATLSNKGSGAPTPAANPANQIGSDRVTSRTRIPMSVPQRKLDAPDIPGQHLYWFLERNVPRALQAGYEFVKDKEVSLNQLGVATSRDISGNADMGTNVKVIAGRDEAGAVEYHVLMKIRLEWWKEDQAALENRNASIMSAIFTKEKIMGSENLSEEDKQTRYVSTALFNRPTRKA
jgi:hypothetical protein